MVENTYATSATPAAKSATSATPATQPTSAHAAGQACAAPTVTLTIDGNTVQVPQGSTILDAANKLGIYIPTLCYFENLNTIGACRVCVVEVAGSERLEAACNTCVREGMDVHTNSARVRASRESTLRLLASTHSFDCVNCTRGDETCVFRKLLLRYNIDPKTSNLFDLAPSGRKNQWNAKNLIQRNAAKCVQCGRCVRVCADVQNLNVWEFADFGSNAHIAVQNNAAMKRVGCIACGQCITHCPTGALSERDDTTKLIDAINNPEITTVVQIAPATRTAWASAFGNADGELGVQRMCACLKKLGVDYVFDTSFAADLTIMEEGTELLGLLQQGEQNVKHNSEQHAGQQGEQETLPLFTSCCPGWVQHALNKWPQFATHLSSAKSPMHMFGSVVKTWWAQKNNINPAQVFSVALMPCVAKKGETRIPDTQSNASMNDMDASLTTREFVRMVRNAGINPNALSDVALDNPLGTATGAGVIFGVTGGVMQAALRTAAYVVTGTTPNPEGFMFEPAGEGKPWTHATFDLAGTPVRCAVAHGIGNADALLTALDAGEVSYDFVEIMACPGGCAGGGGQPIDGTDRELACERANVLYALDKNAQEFPLRFSHENPVVQEMYRDFYGKPCSEKAKQYLHVHTRQESNLVPKE